MLLLTGTPTQVLARILPGDPLRLRELQPPAGRATRPLRDTGAGWSEPGQIRPRARPLADRGLPARAPRARALSVGRAPGEGPAGVSRARGRERGRRPLVARGGKQRGGASGAAPPAHRLEALARRRARARGRGA